MATGPELTAAFKLGMASEDTAVVSAPLGYSMTSTYEEPPEASGPGYLTASKAQAATAVMPGQQWDVSGTNLYNPLPSDPRVEAVLGPLVYKAKPQEDTLEAMRLRTARMEAQIAQMTELLASKVDLSEEPEDEEEPAEAGAPANAQTPTPRKRTRRR